MPTSLYDLSVPTFLQTVRSFGGFLDPAATHFAEMSVDPDNFGNARLFQTTGAVLPGWGQPIGFFGYLMWVAVTGILLWRRRRTALGATGDRLDPASPTELVR